MSYNVSCDSQAVSLANKELEIIAECVLMVKSSIMHDSYGYAPTHIFLQAFSMRILQFMRTYLG